MINRVKVSFKTHRRVCPVSSGFLCAASHRKYTVYENPGLRLSITPKQHAVIKRATSARQNLTWGNVVKVKVSVRPGREWSHQGWHSWYVQADNPVPCILWIYQEGPLRNLHFKEEKAKKWRQADLQVKHC